MPRHRHRAQAGLGPGLRHVATAAAVASGTLAVVTPVTGLGLGSAEADLRLAGELRVDVRAALAEARHLHLVDRERVFRLLRVQARTLLAMSGLTEKTPQNPAGDIEVKFVGLFPGEKLHEELLTDGTVFPSEHPRIMRMKENALRPSVLETCITCLMMACETHERGMIESMVKAIVAEYVPTSPVAPPPLVADTQAPSLIKKFVPFRI